MVLNKGGLHSSQHFKPTVEIWSANPAPNVANDSILFWSACEDADYRFQGFKFWSKAVERGNYGQQLTSTAFCEGQNIWSKDHRVWSAPNYVEVNMMSKDEIVRIIDRAKYELVALILSEAPKIETAQATPSDWLTVEQLAEYWQLRSKKGDVTTAGILKWVARKPKDFPLPSARMGDLLRFKRDEVNEWQKRKPSDADWPKIKQNRSKMRRQSKTQKVNSVPL